MFEPVHVLLFVIVMLLVCVCCVLFLLFVTLRVRGAYLHLADMDVPHDNKLSTDTDRLPSWRHRFQIVADGTPLLEVFNRVCSIADHVTVHGAFFDRGQQYRPLPTDMSFVHGQIVHILHVHSSHVDTLSMKITPIVAVSKEPSLCFTS